MKQLKKWTVVLVDYSGGIGTEVQKLRPSIVVSSNHIHRTLKRATMIPLTRSLNDHFPSRVEINLQGNVSLAMLDQIITVDVSRVIRFLEPLPTHYQVEIQEALREYFAEP